MLSKYSFETSYRHNIHSIGVRCLNVKAAVAVAHAAFNFDFDLYFKCSKLGGVTMPGFENIYRQCS